MAKYNINYACGHGSYTETLFGKTSERERRISWLEINKVCKDCYIKQKKEEVKNQDYIVKLFNSPYNNGIFLAVVAGDTYAIKDKLKSIGCCCVELNESADIFGMRGPKKYWAIEITREEVDINSKIEKFRNIGITKFSIDNSIFSQINAYITNRLQNQE